MTNYVWGNQETQFFYELTPSTIMDAVSQQGFSVTGRCIALNSMENRVYEIEIDNQEDFPELTLPMVVVKFYRPGRWSLEQIQDEHQFMMDLQADEIPVIAPLRFDGKTIFKDAATNLFYTIFPKKGGRTPDEMNQEQWQIVGRMLARLHNTGQTKEASHRIKITPDSFSREMIFPTWQSP